MAEITDVLERLIQRTKENQVPWKTTPEPQTFVAVIGNVSVMILRDRVGDTVLRVLDKAGETLETLDSGVSNDEDWLSELLDLHGRARRMALGVGSQLDELLKALEG